MKAFLALEDGTIIDGKGFGVEKIVEGELIFNTSLTGYVEALTDPSYAGQILMMTYPLIGNYGVTKEYYENDRINAEGLVIKDLCKKHSNWNAEKSLDEFLIEFDIPGIEGVDTRMLTRKVRNYGTMKAVLAVFNDNKRLNKRELLQMVKNQPHITEIDLIEKVCVKDVTRYDVGGKYEVVLLDCGAKRSIFKHLMKRGLNLNIVPFNYPTDKILELNPDALFISNGPGDPIRATKTIETIKELAGKVIIAGICFGHQLTCLALGCKTYKMKFGHHGTNQPVKDFETGRVFISSQNHCFAVDEKSLTKTGLEVTQINLNDQTIEGVKHRELPIICVQYHPEAGPGPHDTHFFFEEFFKMIEG